MATVCALPKEQKMAPVQSLSPGAAVPSMYFVFTKQCSGLSSGKKKVVVVGERCFPGDRQFFPVDRDTEKGEHLKC